MFLWFNKHKLYLRTINTAMFKKLISNLPFNPSLVNQVAFYAKRMHRETWLRATGVTLIIMAVLIQLFAVVSPPESTLARAGNDVIPGGFDSKANAVMLCIGNNHDFQTILRHFGVSCDALNNGQVRRMDYSEYGGQLYSMGRTPYGFAGEVQVSVPGASGNLYMRPMTAWGPHCVQDGKNCQAIVGNRADGSPFMVLFSCGNLVIVGAPKPPPPPPPPLPPPPPPPDVCPQKAGAQSLPEQCDVCPLIPGIQTNSNCLPCPKSENRSDVQACAVLSKTARNHTQQIANANNTTAQANDVIEYKLNVKNTGKATIKAFVVEEDMTDVMEYASILDLHGGKINKARLVKWPAVQIKPGATIIKRLVIKVKDPIPSTQTSASNPLSFDLKMTNVYGNVIIISLPGSPAKTTEIVTTQTLPNTGPGTSLLIGFSVATIAGYFFARSRLMAKELDIIKQEALRY
jgi:uncharacterized repeat protein (TIGR01451 family)